MSAVTIECTEYEVDNKLKQRKAVNSHQFDVPCEVAELSSTIVSELERLTIGIDADVSVCEKFRILKEQSPSEQHVARIQLTRDGITTDGTCQDLQRMFEFVTLMYNKDTVRIGEQVARWSAKPVEVLPYWATNNVADIKYAKYFVKPGKLANNDPENYTNPKIKNLQEYFMDIIRTVLQESMQAKNPDGTPKYSIEDLRNLWNIPASNAPTEQDKEEFHVENVRQVTIIDEADDLQELYTESTDEFNRLINDYNTMTKEFGRANNTVTDMPARVKAASDIAANLSVIGSILPLAKDIHLDIGNENIDLAQKMRVNYVAELARVFDTPNIDIAATISGIKQFFSKYPGYTSLDKYYNVVNMLKDNPQVASQFPALAPLLTTTFNSENELDAYIESNPSIANVINYAQYTLKTRRKSIEEGHQQYEAVKKLLDIINNKLEDISIAILSTKLNPTQLNEAQATSVPTNLGLGRLAQSFMK